MIFVDASFWIALRLPRDDRHATARTLFEENANGPLVTTNLVRAEMWTFLRSRVSHRSAAHAAGLLADSPRIELARVTEDIESKAWDWLSEHDERRYSFVDATSFELMRRRQITHALAFDADFSAAGFVELRP